MTTEVSDIFKWLMDSQVDRSLSLCPVTFQLSPRCNFLLFLRRTFIQSTKRFHVPVSVTHVSMRTASSKSLLFPGPCIDLVIVDAR